MSELDVISQLISTHLNFEDEGHTLTKFIVSLYGDAAAKNVALADVTKEFKKALLENGGEFPQEFLDELLPILKSAHQTTPNIKQEDGAVPDVLHMPDEVEIKKENEPELKHERPQLELHRIFKGVVTNITAFGAFIALEDTNNTTGMCHLSQIAFNGQRIRAVDDVLKVNQEVYVKVIAINDEQKRGMRFPKLKVGLSMRGIDQDTGIDKSAELNRGRQRENTTNVAKGAKRRLTSPERWEIRQLIASGIAKAEDYPDLNGFDDSNGGEHPSEDIDVEIELNHTQPKFLKGQNMETIENEEPQITKTANGTMNKIASKGSKLAQEFKEKRFQQIKEEEREKRATAASNADIDPLRPKTAEANETSRRSWKQAQQSQKVAYGKRTNLPMQQQRESLPVFSMREQLVQSVKDNQFLVIVGETGSGKTTQIVQYLAEEGFNLGPNGLHKIIGCTQPRRVAAVSVAKRVAEERGSQLGGDVGYNIRFEDVTSPSTNIKYMTDGMLEIEAINDTAMSKYSVIMLDEAHERTIATDVLFALLKKAAKVNPDLKVIITSATLDSEKFSRYFNNCPVVTIPGRTYPVEVLYTQEPELDYLSAALDSVIQIHVSEPEGDILVFLTGQEEIDTSCEVLYEKVQLLGNAIPELIILPVYSALPSEMQSRIFEPTPKGSRKVILATNIAETSITIDGIFYVVDPGYVKINAYDPKLGMDSLKVAPISQAQANQRSGRAGRTGPGKCYRLYTEKSYQNEMLPNTVPEIQRQNLSHTILLLKAMGINDLLNFEFMDPPSTHAMLSALHDLYTVDALDDNGFLTDVGRRMANFPMEPKLAKTLLASAKLGCSDEMLTIVAMLSVQTIFYRPKDKQRLADQRKARFNHSYGDHLTLLNVYRSWLSNGGKKSWCQDNFIQERSLRKAKDVRRQLSGIMQRFKHPIISCGNDIDRIRRALTEGFFKHSAKKDSQEGFKTLVENTLVSLHPASALQNKNADYVVYHTLLLTTREYMHCVTAIEGKWLAELAPKFFAVGDPSKINSAKKRQKIVPLYDRFDKEQAWRLSAQLEHKKRALESLNE